jgi:hypothetical protein
LEFMKIGILLSLSAAVVAAVLYLWAQRPKVYAPYGEEDSAG